MVSRLEVFFQDALGVTDGLDQFLISSAAPSWSPSIVRSTAWVNERRPAIVRAYPRQAAGDRRQGAHPRSRRASVGDLDCENSERDRRMRLQEVRLILK